MAQQAGSANEIAEALIRLGVVGREQLTAELARARAEGQKFAGTMGGQVAQATEKASAANDSFVRSSGRLTSIIGKIGAGFGVLAAFNIGQAIGQQIADLVELFKRLNSEQTAFIGNLGGLTATDATKKIDEEIRRVQDRIGALRDNGLFGIQGTEGASEAIYGPLIKQLERYSQELQKQLDRERKVRAGEMQRQSDLSAKKFGEEVRKAIEDGFNAIKGQSTSQLERVSTDVSRAASALDTLLRIQRR